MNELLEAITAAVADGATVDQKRDGATACRTILTALETAPGTPIAPAEPPIARPLAGIDPTQALDLLIARLRAALPQAEASASAQRTGFRVALVQPPARGPHVRVTRSR